MPLISVCIAAEPSEQYLKTAVESVLKQTFTDFEILIVHGTSASEYLRNICAADSRVRLLEMDASTKSGCSTSNLHMFNLALTESRGSLIQFLSEKDILEPDCLQTFAQAFALAPALSLVLSSANLITADGVIISQLKGESADVILSGRQVASSCLLNLEPLFNYISTACFRKEFALSGLDLRFFLLSYFEFLVRVAAQGDCLFLSRALCNVRKFEHQTEANAIKESLVWLHDFALLRELFRQFLQKEEINFEKEDFDSEYWSGKGSISHIHMVKGIQDHWLRLKITADEGLRAARDIEGWSSDYIFESYVRLTFEMAGHIHALNLWKNDALKEAHQKIEQARRKAKAAAQAECEIEYGKETKRLQAQVDELYAELNQLKEEHVKVLRSGSWLMTAPIRRFRASFLDGRSISNKLSK